MATVLLKSNDEEVFEVERDVIQLSKTIDQMLKDLRMDSGDEKAISDPIPLPNVESGILKKVIEWCRHHKDDPPFVLDEDRPPRTDDIPAWDIDFLKTNQTDLFQLILAANYLHIEGLLDVTCKAVANMIKGKKPEEIRRQFNIVNDFTPEEEEQIKRENAWCEE